MRLMMIAAAALLFAVGADGRGAAAGQDIAPVIRPGEPWLDTNGELIQAHGGGIIKEGDTWYWFGEDRGGIPPGQKPAKRSVACYASKDLVNWTFRNRVLETEAPEPRSEEHTSELQSH